MMKLTDTRSFTSGRFWKEMKASVCQLASFLSASSTWIWSSGQLTRRQKPLITWLSLQSVHAVKSQQEHVSFETTWRATLTTSRTPSWPLRCSTIYWRCLNRLTVQPRRQKLTFWRSLPERYLRPREVAARLLLVYKTTNKFIKPSQPGPDLSAYFNLQKFITEGLNSKHYLIYMN